MRPFVTLSMIVRDEARVLGRCLESVSGWAEEIVVVDTGSTDDTKRIAETYQARIYDFEWTNDFAAARNYALSKATGRWILVLDADEYIDPGELPPLNEFLQQLDSSKPIGIVLPIYNYVDQEGSGKISRSSSIRLFSRHPNLAFERAIHEQLRTSTGKLVQLDHEFPIYHTGYTTETLRLKDKSARNEAIFSQMRRDGRWTPYDSFTQGNEYFALDRYEEALTCYEEADQPSESNQAWLPLCIGNRISCLLRLQRYTEAWMQIKRGQKLWPKACDFYWLEGYTLAQLGLDEDALRALQTCLQRSESSNANDSCLISPNYGTTLPLQQAATLHLRRFEVQQAVAYLTKLCYASPNQQAVLLQLIKLISASEPLDRVESFLHSLYPQPLAYQRVMIIEVLILLGLRELAERYWKRTILDGDPVTSSIRLQYALLTDQVDMGATVLQSPPKEPDRAWRASKLRASFQWKDRVKEKEMLPEEEAVDIITTVCMQYFREGHFELYDAVINSYPDMFESLANKLGDALFEERQFELALDYYSLLLQRNALSPRGYENVARLYISQGEIDEGLEFAKEASIAMPDRLDLQILMLRHTKDVEQKRRLLHTLRHECPGLADFPALPA